MKVGQKRLNRLLRHLLLLEQLTGKPLRPTPRGSAIRCPCENFAPDEDATGGRFWWVSTAGAIRYSACTYRIYTRSDSVWWLRLSTAICRAVTEYAQAWVAAGKPTPPNDA